MRRTPTAIRLIGLLFLGLAACSEGGTSPSEPGTIAGTVQVEGSALEGVIVDLSGAAAASATTDASGEFTFSDLEPGTYEVTISAWPDDVTFQDPDENVEVTSGTQATVEFSGDYIRTATIEGTVEVDGEGVSGATVTLAGAESMETTTDAGGDFRFAQLRAGTYTVRVSGVGSDVTMDEVEKTVSLEVEGRETLAFSGERLAPAQVSMDYVERPGSALRMNLQELEGDVDAVVQVDPGNESVARVRLFLAGRLMATREFPGGLTSSKTVELRVNTAAFDPDTGQPFFPNGPTFFEAHVDTEGGGSSAAIDRLDVGLDNDDRIAGVSALDEEDGVVSNGRRWFGNRDLRFEVVPVLYNQSRVIGAITLQATGDPSGNGGPSLDLGSGPGQPHKVEGPPFIFTAALADNQGIVEDRSAGNGHSLRVVRVFDGGGVDISSDFLPSQTTPLVGYYVDFVPPQVPGGSAISVGGNPVLGGEWFSAGDFGLTSMSETGSGQATVTYEVADAGTTEPILGASSIDDLAERRNDRYVIRAVEVTDAVGNSTPAGSLPPASPSFGVDRSAVAITDVVPTNFLIMNNTDAAGDGIADNELLFRAEDPELSNGTAGSGFATASAEAVNTDGASLIITPSITPNISGLNRVGLSSLGDSRWTVTVTVKDGATPANETSFAYEITVDKTPPSISILDAPPPSVTTSNSSVTFTIGGEVTDTNGLSEVLIVVRDADDNTTDMCETMDAPISMGSGPGQVDVNQVDVTPTADAFSTQIRVNKQAGQQDLCFYVEAADNAKDRTGASEANESRQFVRTVINWN